VRSKSADVTWLPKSVVCLSYYDPSRFHSDLMAALVLALRIGPFSIAIATASGLPALYGVSSAASAAFLASALGDSKIRVSAPNTLILALGIGAKHGSWHHRPGG
jgi:MFS superfamily sulfate permease-like transporter